jgi:hypothetical protein
MCELSCMSAEDQKLVTALGKMAARSSAFAAGWVRANLVSYAALSSR